VAELPLPRTRAEFDQRVSLPHFRMPVRIMVGEEDYATPPAMAEEMHAAIAEYDSGNDSFTLWNTTQNPHVARLVLSAFIGVAPEHKLRVIAPDVGGGFGSKIFIYPEEMVALWASKKVNRAMMKVAITPPPRRLPL
jgi:CO/xanthine dehydrogenase Mo-binding subunit